MYQAIEECYVAIVYFIPPPLFFIKAYSSLKYFPILNSPTELEAIYQTYFLICIFKLPLQVHKCTRYNLFTDYP